jgi:hypothetical protein
MPQNTLSLPARIGLYAGPVPLRIALIWITAASFCALSTLTRIALMAKSYAANQLGVLEMPRVLLAGLGYDVMSVTPTGRREEIWWSSSAAR